MYIQAIITHTVDPEKISFLNSLPTKFKQVKETVIFRIYQDLILI